MSPSVHAVEYSNVVEVNVKDNKTKEVKRSTSMKIINSSVKNDPYNTIRMKIMFKPQNRLFLVWIYSFIPNLYSHFVFDVFLMLENICYSRNCNKSIGKWSQHWNLKYFLPYLQTRFWNAISMHSTKTYIFFMNYFTIELKLSCNHPKIFDFAHNIYPVLILKCH